MALKFMIPERVYFGKLRFYVNNFTLAPVKKVTFKFDPFHENVRSIREFMFVLNSIKVRKTNPMCLVKTEVLNDRSDPEVTFVLDNGKKLLMKTKNLGLLEAIKSSGEVLSQFDKPKDQAPSV